MHACLKLFSVSNMRFSALVCMTVMVVVAGMAVTARADVVDDAELWFNDISTMKANFIQVASDGSSASGEIHLRRPYQMKIIYDLEEPMILQTTRIWLHVDRPEEQTLTSLEI